MVRDKAERIICRLISSSVGVDIAAVKANTRLNHSIEYP